MEQKKVEVKLENEEIVMIEVPKTYGLWRIKRAGRKQTGKKVIKVLTKRNLPEKPPRCPECGLNIHPTVQGKGVVCGIELGITPNKSRR